MSRSTPVTPRPWLRFAGWMALGTVVYFLCSYRNSEESKLRSTAENTSDAENGLPGQREGSTS